METGVSKWARRAVWLAVLGCLALPAFAQDSVPSSVAVFRIEPRGFDLPEDQVVALSAYLGEAFAEKSRSRVVNWLELLTRFEEGQDPKACNDRECQRRLEREFGVDYSLATVLVPLGQGCVLTGVVYAADGDTSVRTGLAKGGCDGDSLVASLDALAAKLVAAGPLFPRTAPGAQPAAGPATPEDGVRSRADAAFADLAAEEAARGQPVAAGSPEEWEGAPGTPGEGAPAYGGEVPPPPLEGDPDAGDISAMDDWPRFLLTLSLSYSPAPLMTPDTRTDWEDGIKQCDQIGPQLVFEARLGRYLAIGGHLAALWAEQDTRFVEAAFRFGFHIPLFWKLALYGRLGLGLSSWETARRWQDDYAHDFEYFGFYGGLGLGLRLMIFRHLGVQFELAGSISPMVNQNRYYLENVFLDYQDDELVLWKLELNLGLITGW